MYLDDFKRRMLLDGASTKPPTQADMEGLIALFSELRGRVNELERAGFDFTHCVEDRATIRERVADIANTAMLVGLGLGALEFKIEEDF